MNKSKLVPVLYLSLLAVSCGKDAVESALTQTANADGGSISSIKDCVASSGNLIFKYQIVTFGSGDKHIGCSISDLSSQYSSSRFVRANGAGASTGTCTLVYDIDSAGSGSWKFTDDGTTTSAVYMDVGSSSFGTTISFSNCTTS